MAGSSRLWPGDVSEKLRVEGQRHETGDGQTSEGQEQHRGHFRGEQLPTTCLLNFFCSLVISASARLTLATSDSLRQNKNWVDLTLVVNPGIEIRYLHRSVAYRFHAVCMTSELGEDEEPWNRSRQADSTFETNSN